MGEDDFEIRVREIVEQCLDARIGRAGSHSAIGASSTGARRLRREQRDSALREAAGAFYAGSLRQRASDIERDLGRLAAASVVSAPGNAKLGALRRVLELSDGELIGAAHLRDVLAGRRNKQTP